MSKISKNFSKQYKIIFNSKISFFIIFLIPFLLFVVFGIFLLNNDKYELNVVLIGDENSNLIKQYNSVINDAGFISNIEVNFENCFEKLKTRETDLCVVFPKNVSDGEIIEAQIYSENSNPQAVNFAKTLLLPILDTKTDEIKISGINEILEVLKKNKEGLDDKNRELEILKKEIDISNLNLKNSIKLVDSINSHLGTSSSVYEELSQEQDKVIEISKNFSKKYTANKKKIENHVDDSNLNSTIKNQIEDYFEEIDKIIESFEEENKKIEDSSKFSNAFFLEKSNENERTKLKKVGEDLKIQINNFENSNNNKLESFNKLEKLVVNDNQNLKNITNFQAKSIISPINFETKIVSNNLDFAKFEFVPNLFSLIILIVVITISSIIALNEKTSFAFQRNILTKISSFTFIFSNYLFLLSITFLQIFFILILFNLFFLNFWELQFFYLIILLVLIISIFIFLGFIIGYISKSHIQVFLLNFFLVFTLIITSGSFINLNNYDKFSNYLIEQINPYLSSKILFSKLLFENVSFLEFLELSSILVIKILILFLIVLIIKSFLLKRFVYHWLSKILDVYYIKKKVWNKNSKPYKKQIRNKLELIRRKLKL